MPKIDELMNSSKKKFKKSDYRPWNYMDEIENESKEQNIGIKDQSYRNHSGIIIQHSEATLTTEGVKEDSEFVANNEVSKKPILEKSLIKSNNENCAILKDYETALDVIFRLTGHQRTIFNFIIDRCLSRSLLKTGVVKGEMLAVLCGTSLKMIKTSIQRIVAKGLIERGKGKTGRGGFYSFEITDLIKNAALESQRTSTISNQLEINKDSYGNQWVQQNSNKGGIALNSRVNLTEEWTDIDFEMVKEIGFSETQLMQLQGKNSPQVIQESIYHFAYGMQHNSQKFKTYPDPLNVLMGVLRKGQAWIEGNYKSQQEIAMQQFLEQKKLQQQRETALKEEAIKVEFEEWLANLAPEDKENISSNFHIPSGLKNSKEAVVRSKFMEYFKRNYTYKL